MHSDQAIANITHIMNEIQSGGIPSSEIHKILDMFTQSGMITLEKSQSDPYHAPKVVQRAANPLKGKGKSYGQHVSGPNGWGTKLKQANDWDDF